MRLRRREPGLPSFRRQHPVGPYVLDFYCSAARLCIEVDGYTHLTEDRPERDARRDAHLHRLGIRVMRYAAATVLADPDGISASILETADELAAQAPPP
ncbi:endonuclease domain-containing protein [Phenylobacterium terrae]|uniref:Endonuclease domain-containing protein n=1 Tax=Phenylobacterium terrae TaxID=2665495 RepID=A0ABW4MVZ8_9CAUL